MVGVPTLSHAPSALLHGAGTPTPHHRKRAAMTAVLPGRDVTLTSSHPSPLRSHDVDPLLESDARDVLAIMHRAARLARTAEHTVADRLLLDRVDRLVARGGAGAIAAIEVLGSLIGPDADEQLGDLAASDDLLLRRHAIWRLGGRSPIRSVIPTIAVEIQRGGLDTFHAHRTLRRWSHIDPASVLRAATTELAVVEHAAARARLVDLVGAIDDRGTDEFLVDVAVDDSEPDASRLAAIGALGERRSELIGTALDALARSDDTIGAHAALALQADRPARRRRATDGLHIAQLVLSDGLDGQLSRGGRGETGGVASLLVSLGSALAAHPAVGHVLTIGRGAVSDALVGPVIHEAEPCSYGTIAVGDPSRPVDGAGDAWEHLPAIERGLRRAIRLGGPVDMLHLRMADVGTLIGAEIAAEMGIPTCFSLAPDPHNVIQSLQQRGELDGTTFSRLEADQHLWYRARLIERLGARADRVALFPRATSFPFLDEIAELDDATRPGRTAVVAEGIDLRAVRRAEDEITDTDVTPDVVRELASLIPGRRRGLPLLVSAGRLHPVKGMERVVSAWAACAELRRSCNLVIVGGDLEHPSPSEAGVLDAIERTLRQHPDARPGLVLLGGRPHADVARLLASASRGERDAWSSGGVYVDGALKEEFGLAVLEGLVSGLVVVAPSTGGPSTYVDHGDTGVLVAPDGDLGAAVASAYELTGRAGRVERARRMVESCYSVDTMASQLVDLYRARAA